MAELEKVA